MNFQTQRQQRLSAAQLALHARADRDLIDRIRVSTLPQLLIPVVFALGGDVARDLPGPFWASVVWILLLLAGRLILARYCRLSQDAGTPRAAGWLRVIVLSGIAGWSLLFVAIIRHYGLGDWNTTLALVHLMGLNSIAMATLASHYPIFRLYVLFGTVPVSLIVAVSGGQRGLVVGIGLALYCALMLLQCRRINASYWAGLQDNALLSVKMEELDVARRAADDASRAKSEFLANISHELRTPMNGVLGMTALVLDSELNAEQRDYLDVAQNSAQALLRLLNEMLDLSRIEAGRLELLPETFDLHLLLEQVRRTFQHEADSTGLTFIVHSGTEIPHALVGDAGRLRQVLINLAANALKFTPSGGVEVSAALDRAEAGFVFVRFQVRDSGVGVPDQMQRAIFEPFVQVDGSLRRKHGGAGLGLAIASRLVSLMQGRIEIQSHPGEGSTFSFTARFEAASAPAGESAHPAARPEMLA